MFTIVAHWSLLELEIVDEEGGGGECIWSTVKGVYIYILHVILLLAPRPLLLIDI